MEGPRAPTANEVQTIFRFLNTNLRPGLNWSIEAEYPTVLNESNSQFMRVITDKNEVLSHAVVKPMLVKCPAGIVKVAGVGSVVTSDRHRNQGLSTQIIESCLDLARSQNCDFAILWTNLFEFYRRMGFELAGQEIALIFDRPLQLESKLRFVEGSQIDPQAILKVYSQHRVATVRTVEEVRKYLQIPNSRVFTAWSPEGSLVAYAVEGKGADLSGYIHEWGGNVTPLLELVSFIQTKRPGILTMIVPAHSVNLRRRAEDLGAKTANGFLGMIRVLNFQRLSAIAQRYIKNLGCNHLKLEIKDGKLLVGADNATVSLTSEQEFTQLLFGPEMPKSVSKLPEATLKDLRSCLPIPIWLWGWDSV